jgi:hypothetical protein
MHIIPNKNQLFCRSLYLFEISKFPATVSPAKRLSHVSAYYQFFPNASSRRILIRFFLQDFSILVLTPCLKSFLSPKAGSNIKTSGSILFPLNHDTFGYHVFARHRVFYTLASHVVPIWQKREHSNFGLKTSKLRYILICDYNSFINSSSLSIKYFCT